MSQRKIFNVLIKTRH